MTPAVLDAHMNMTLSLITMSVPGVRFMTAITPAYAHAYQTMCLALHFPGVPHHTFRLPKPKSRYPFLPNDRSITSELGNDYHGRALKQMVVLASLRVKPLLDGV